MRTLRVLPVLVVAGLWCGACGGGSSEPSSGRAERATRAPATDAPAPAAPSEPTLRPVDGLVATSNGSLPVFASPDAAEPSSALAPQTGFGSPTTVRVVAWQGPEGEWLEVSLPVRPNGSRGFVRVSDITLARVEHAVVVDLAERSLRVVRGGEVVLTTTVAIGSPENPTPTGDFFVTDVLDTGDDDSAYGRVAIGISARSLSLSEFAGGDGQIGIHGTNQPGSIGQAVSHGCVRVPNDVAVQLASLLPLGTPVTIR
jgi:lipoprotein-anchoring transpeptidase ErfK/SrfK